MVIQQKIALDLIFKTGELRVDAVQNEKYSRDLLISLNAGGVAWTIPTGTTAIIHYEKSDKTGGSYNTLPDGTEAFSFEGNVLRIRLAPQVCTAAGPVRMAVSLINGESELTTFRIGIDVQSKPGIDAKSENYVKLTGYIPATGWSPNVYLGTDADGNVAELETPEYAKPTDEQVQAAVEAYLTQNPASGVVPEEDIRAAVDAWFVDNPVEASDETVQAAVEAYFAENPIQSGATAEQAAQLAQNTLDIAQNTKDIAANADAIAENTAVLQRRVVSAKFSLSGNAVTVERTFQDAESSSGTLALDDSGVPTSYTEGGTACTLEFEGFDEEFLDLWEGGSY